MGEGMEANSRDIAETIGSNQDLLTLILLRLPAKSLVKFQSVSKQWLSLISDPIFRFTHSRLQKILNPTPTSLLFIKDSYSAPQFDIIPLKDSEDAVSPGVGFSDFLNVPHLTIDDRLTVHDSRDGLLLYSGTSKSGTSRSFSVCNPLTKQFKILSIPSDEPGALDVGLSLAFDPLKSPHYKVICIYVIMPKETHFIDVYSSETDSWSMLGSALPLPDDYYMHCHMGGVFFNGAMHWYSYGDTSLYFDVNSETLNTMPMPMPMPMLSSFSTNIMNCRVKYFGESGGHLIMARSTDPCSLEFDVLEMASDYSGWSLRYHVNLQSMRPVFPELTVFPEVTNVHFRSCVLTMIKGGTAEELMAVIVVEHKAIPYRAIFYNLHDGMPTKICDLQVRPDHGVYIYGDYIYGHPYFQSLICL